MEDKLKKFAQDHREAFDTFEPRPDLWQDISRELEKKQSQKVIPFYQRAVWRYAAVVTLLVGVGYALVQYGRGLGRIEPRGPELSLVEIAPQMAEVESYYMAVINQKKQERGAYDLRQLGVETDFKGELSKLDSSYAQLKRELYTNPNKQRVIDAMVQNLQIRISILNEQLEVLNRIKQAKKENRHANVPI
jgi:hypothetical protein